MSSHTHAIARNATKTGAATLPDPPSIAGLATTAALNAEIARAKAAEAAITGGSSMTVAQLVLAVQGLGGHFGPTPPPTARSLGVWEPGSFWTPTDFDTYAALLGRMPAFATVYEDWGPNADNGYVWSYVPGFLAACASRGIKPIITWEPHSFTGSPADSTFSLANILAGNFDSYIETWVAGAAAYPGTIYIRFAHEMNLQGAYPWDMGSNGNTPAQYVAVWQKIVNMFRAGGATNVKWVWSPNVIGQSGQYPLTGLYPGDAYVDMVGMDGYNWGTSGQGEAGWYSFTQIFGATYAQIQALTSKPILVTEMASTESGGDKAAWITSAFLTEIPASFPAIVGVLWFDQLKETTWQIDSSSASLAAYQAVVASASWQAAFP